MSTPPEPIAPDIALHALLVKLFAEHGAVELGRAADGYLIGIKTALGACVGREAARKVFERHAREVD